MRIKKISIYKADLPMKEGSYSWAKQSFSSFDSTIVSIETDSDQTGIGETCPLGPAYLPAFADGARAAIENIAPHLLGLDPTNIDNINRVMDQVLKGHFYAKSAIDIACWDILGKSVSLPVYKLLGGMQNEKIKLFKVVSRREPDQMVRDIVEYQKQGFKQFQMKVGESVEIDIERIIKVSEKLKKGNILNADANCGWLQHEAVRVVSAINNISLYLEQPCESYEECFSIRKFSNHPMILDECMDSINRLIQGYRDHAMDVVNLKINRIGGLTKARTFRDLCINFGILMTIEDSWGGEIATAAIAHLAHSTPSYFHFQSSAFHEYTEVELAKGGPIIKDGYMFVNNEPGLGVSPNFDTLGNPLREFK